MIAFQLPLVSRTSCLRKCLNEGEEDGSFGKDCVLIADIMRVNEGVEDVHVEEFCGEDVGSSKLELGEEARKSCHRKRDFAMC